MIEQVTKLQQAKVAYRQARRDLAAYARAYWIGKRATVAGRGWEVTATITSITPAGRVQMHDTRGTLDIEELHVWISDDVCITINDPANADPSAVNT